ncbi:DoxX family protein [Streptomyces sp. NPDC006610]|uniref:DoxX family protein n=1 Tax=Streptomyces sp. NPDC006610 TaxID=3154584 RepID=UPI0033AEDBF0
MTRPRTPRRGLPHPSRLASLAAGYQRRETAVLRVSVGVLYVWFGVLKFFPALSPAQDIATLVMSVLTHGMVPAEVSRPCLALMEVLIGVGLITGRLPALVLGTFFVHMAGVFATLVIVPAQVWSHPLIPSLEGQYIIKNLVLVAACLSVAAAAARVPAGTGIVPEEELRLARCPSCRSASPETGTSAPV